MWQCNQFKQADVKLWLLNETQVCMVNEHSCSELVGPPEECEQLLSAAGRPGQIHTVVAAIRGHYEATPAAGVSDSVMVESKTGWKKM